MSDQITLSIEDMKAAISGKKTKTGILLVQLGSPINTTDTAIKDYLLEFLTDPFVIHKQGFFWKFLLKTKIIPARIKKFKAGSPLITITHNLSQKLYENLSAKDPFVIIRSAMRYPSLSLKDTLSDMIENQNVQKLIILPLFPQYSHTTTGSIQNKIKIILKSLTKKPKIIFLNSFCNHDAYIQNLSNLIQETLDNQKPEKLILSYHGLPISYIEKGDPYVKMCEETTYHLKDNLRIADNNVLMTYQSRFGKDKWTEPNTKDTVIKLAQKGITNIAIACPSFTIDCLETSDEIGLEARQAFLDHGGKNFTLIPSLNDNPKWVLGLAEIIKGHY